jgi:hypothetical protein
MLLKAALEEDNMVEVEADMVAVDEGYIEMAADVRSRWMAKAQGPRRGPAVVEGNSVIWISGILK